jgi:hypothetical protein
MEERPMRMMTKTWTLALAAVALLGTAACEDAVTDGNALDEEALLIDAAMIAADGMFQDLAHMDTPSAWAGIGTGPSAAGIEIQGTKSFSKTVTFFDAAGKGQARLDPETTASMHVVSELEREATHTFWTASIKRDRDMWVTGLEGAETIRTWNGTSTGDVDRSRHPEGGSVRTYDMESSAVMTTVVKGVPRADNPYPLSGSITRTIHAVITTDNVEEIKDVVTTITFDGDKMATMNVDGEIFEVNLDDRGVKKRFQRKNNG